MREKVLALWFNLLCRLDRTMDSKLNQVLEELKGIKMTLAQLQAQVAQNTSIEESAVTLIQGLAAQLAAIKQDPVAIQALADSLSKSAGDLSKAITDNTPAQT
jgi:hypothetical protein